MKIFQQRRSTNLHGSLIVITLEEMTMAVTGISNEWTVNV